MRNKISAWRVELRESGEIRVIAAAGRRGDASGHLELNDEEGGVQEIGMFEQAVHDGRSDVVGKIAVDAEALVGGKFGEIEGEDIARDHRDIGERGRLFAQAREQSGVEFDGDQAAGLLGQKRGHLAVSGADFDPDDAVRRGRASVFGVRRRCWRGGVGENESSDALAPRAGEEMLA